MKNNNFSPENAEVRSYAPPAYRVIVVGTERVICASETEKVIEIEGEW